MQPNSRNALPRLGNSHGLVGRRSFSDYAIPLSSRWWWSNLYARILKSDCPEAGAFRTALVQAGVGKLRAPLLFGKLRGAVSLRQFRSVLHVAQQQAWLVGPGTLNRPGRAPATFTGTDVEDIRQSRDTGSTFQSGCTPLFRHSAFGG